MNQFTYMRLIDHTKDTTINHVRLNALGSFAIDDALAISVGQELAEPTLRLWSHPKTVVLGIPDTRLPYIKEGVQYLAHQGYDVIVRNSGGLAVIIDEGVLNMSLILPHMKHLSIDKAYEIMYQFIERLLSPYTRDIKAYEIVGSYCPGDYDLSIRGKKFAGISQRRVRNGVAVQIYLDIAGDHLQRALHIKKFYELALKNEQTNFKYPTINPDVLASLDHLLVEDISFSLIKQRAIKTLNSIADDFYQGNVTKEEIDIFMKRLEQMIKRNKKIHSWLI